ncbi:hypothetical protein [Nocardia jejuensis]|nr:hypothetical protein [Nocardia jejuensis]
MTAAVSAELFPPVILEEEDDHLARHFLLEHSPRPLPLKVR